MSETILGGCQCGAVRYRLSAPVQRVEHCHCSMCRRLHGALFASFGVARRADFQLEGEDALGDYPSSPGVHRRFCTACGGQLAVEIDSKPEQIVVCLGSLDAGMAPGHAPAAERHAWWGSKVAWYDPGDNLPRHHGSGG